MSCAVGLEDSGIFFDIHPFSKSILSLVADKYPDLIHDFLRTQSTTLPLPRFFSDKTAILWRGCTAEQLIQMIKTSSAGGEPFNVDTRAPTEEEAIMQVGEKTSLPEFTDDFTIARNFGGRSFIVVCKIETKYLTRGSAAESGHICLKDAPVTVLGWVQEGDLSITNETRPKKPHDSYELP